MYYFKSNKPTGATVQKSKKDGDVKSNSSGLSAESTALERRLMSSAAAKKQPPTNPAQSKAPTTSKTTTTIPPTSQKVAVKSEPTEQLPTKRKKNFWEPDSDTEYDIINKAKRVSVENYYSVQNILLSAYIYIYIVKAVFFSSLFLSFLSFRCFQEISNL